MESSVRHRLTKARAAPHRRKLVRRRTKTAPENRRVRHPAECNPPFWRSSHRDKGTSPLNVLCTAKRFAWEFTAAEVTGGTCVGADWQWWPAEAGACRRRGRRGRGGGR